MLPGRIGSSCQCNRTTIPKAQCFIRILKVGRSVYQQEKSRDVGLHLWTLSTLYFLQSGLITLSPKILAGSRLDYLSKDLLVSSPVCAFKVFLAPKCSLCLAHCPRAEDQQNMSFFLNLSHGPQITLFPQSLSLQPERRVPFTAFVGHSFLPRRDLPTGLRSRS